MICSYLYIRKLKLQRRLPAPLNHEIEPNPKKTQFISVYMIRNEKMERKSPFDLFFFVIFAIIK